MTPTWSGRRVPCRYSSGAPEEDGKKRRRKLYQGQLRKTKLSGKKSIRGWRGTASKEGEIAERLGGSSYKKGSWKNWGDEAR